MKTVLKFLKAELKETKFDLAMHLHHIKHNNFRNHIKNNSEKFQTKISEFEQAIKILSK